jgi:phosphoribosylformylglycinamidine synthase subunit PurS
MTFDVTVEVRLRPGIADPQGATIERALPALGFEGVAGVSVGKSIRFTIDAENEDAARELVSDMCERFLTNPVIEDSSIAIGATSAAAAR